MRCGAASTLDKRPGRQSGISIVFLSLDHPFTVSPCHYLEDTMIGAIMYFLIWFPLQFIRLLWWSWHIEGLENLPPRGHGMVLAINHLHWLDVLIIGASLPLSYRPAWIAKTEIFAN